MYAVTIDSVVSSPSFRTKGECRTYMKILRKEHPEYRGHEWNICDMPNNDYSIKSGCLSSSLCW